MARTTRILNVSMPPGMAKEYERLAKEQGKSKSELFREMMASYRRERELRKLEDLQRYGRRRAREKGIRTEKDAERLVFRHR
jgi:metal-responsive CopG/Arc/MetJ family transcriptional regulator